MKKRLLLLLNTLLLVTPTINAVTWKEKIKEQGAWIGTAAAGATLSVGTFFCKTMLSNYAFKPRNDWAERLADFLQKNPGYVEYDQDCRPAIRNLTFVQIARHLLGNGSRPAWYYQHGTGLLSIAGDKNAKRGYRINIPIEVVVNHTISNSFKMDIATPYDRYKEYLSHCNDHESTYRTLSKWCKYPLVAGLALAGVAITYGVGTFLLSSKNETTTP